MALTGGPSWPLVMLPSWHGAHFFMAFMALLAFIGAGSAAAFMARRFIAAFFFITLMAFMAAGAAAFMARRFMAAFFFITLMAFMAQVPLPSWHGASLLP